MNDLEQKTESEGVVDYFRGCANPENARLYGNFQERAALNITQFPKIQGSLLIRMGMVYPIMSYLTDKIGISPDASSELLGMEVNYHTWIAGYFAYLAEIQAGLSKYPIEAITRLGGWVKDKFGSKNEKKN
jgi:hypothetical protein